MFISLGLTSYAAGLAAAAAYFFQIRSLYGYHPGLFYVAGLLLSLVFCPLGYQAPYARSLAGMASFFSTASAAIVAGLAYLSRQLKDRNPWLLYAVCLACLIPLLCVSLAAPLLLFIYHLALARNRRPFWLLSVEGSAGLLLIGARVYAAFHPQYQLMANQAIGGWLIAYALTLLLLSISYLTRPYQKEA